MIKLRRDPQTGEVVAYEDGEPVGSVTTMGDLVGEDDGVYFEGGDRPFYVKEE